MGARAQFFILYRPQNDFAARGSFCTGPRVISGRRKRLDCAPARPPQCFLHTESDWSARSLGRPRVFHTPRAIGAPARSGATVFFSPRERLERPSARAPPWFSHPESDWITRSLGRHRVFLTTRTPGALVRSGATVVFASREQLDYESARAPPCFLHTERAWSADHAWDQDQKT